MIKLEVAEKIELSDEMRKYLISEFDKLSSDFEENDEFTYIVDDEQEKLLFWVEKEKEVFRITKVFDKEHVL